MTEKIKREECHVGIYPCCIEFENGKVVRNCYACIERYAYDKGRADGAKEFAEWLYAKANVPIYDYYGRKTKTDDLLTEWQKGEG